MAADGSINIEVGLDDKKAQVELNKVIHKLDSLNNKVKQLESARIPLAEQFDNLAVKLDEANAKLYEMQNAAPGTYSAETIAAQAAYVKNIETQWDAVNRKLNSYDSKIASANAEIEQCEIQAGELSEQLAGAGNEGSGAGEAISAAMEKATGRIEKLGNRIAGLIKRVFIFSMITKGLRALRSYYGEALKSNDEFSQSLGRLKGALLTAFQPIYEAIVPALIFLMNVLAQVISVISSLFAFFTGKSTEEYEDNAEALNEEAEAIEGVGGAGEKAAKQLAKFDEINKLGDEDKGGAGGGGKKNEINPIFDANGNWLEDALSGVEEKVTAALLLAGIALICLGAALGSLPLVLAGLLLIGAGIYVGSETGVLDDWAKKLGLDRAEELVTLGLLVAGLAAIVFGIILGNLLLVLAGAALIGAGLKYGEQTGVLSEWAQKLGFDNAKQMVATAALVLGMAAIVFGIIFHKWGLVIAGAALLGYAIKEGKDSGALDKWKEKLGLDSVTDYIGVALQLAGIAMIAIGACLGNIALVIAGAAALAAGIVIDAVGEETLAEWWEKLKLTTVQQWVGVVTILAGIALIAIGAAMANILMILGGMVLVGIATATNANEGNLKDWVEVLGLQKVAGWVTAALLLGGMALLVIGIVTANIPMVLAGLGLLGAGVSIGITTGTFQSWLDEISGAFTRFGETMGEKGRKLVEDFNQWWTDIKEGAKDIWGKIVAWWDEDVAPVFTIQWWTDKLSAIGEGAKAAMNGAITAVENGLNWIIDKANTLSLDIDTPWGEKHIGISIPRIQIPRLAEGAVIPPNREFLAMLGDQKSGTNIEAPLETIVAAFRQALNESGGGNRTLVLQVGEYEFGRLVFNAFNTENSRVGFSSVT